MTEALTLESLGLSRAELIERLIERLVSEMSGEEIGSKVRDLVQKRTDETVARLAEERVLPNVQEYVENLTLQETNRWGEKVGRSLTFVEYLAERAEAYLAEKVNFEGKTKGEAVGLGWRGEQTRITHMVHQHLHYRIESAMKDALKVVMDSLSEDLAETARMKLQDLAKGLRVQVQQKR